MRLKEKAMQMRELVQVRDLQRLRSEAEALKAAQALAARSETLARAEQERDAGVTAWLETMSAQAVRPELASLWSQALRQREAALLVARRDADRAAEERDRRNREYNAATLRHDVAGDLARKARSEFARKSEELALQDALDVHITRGRRDR